MIKRIITFTILSVISFPMIAISQQTVPLENLNLNQQEKEQQRKLVASGKACEKALKKHRTDGADYIPGVDVRGKPVTSANVDGQNYEFDFPNVIEFDLTLNAFQAAGRNDLATLFPDSNFNLGRIKYNISSGKLTYNGKTLTDEQNNALSDACLTYQKLKSQD
ncbi:hypothetical protein [Curvivirga aplysinae]|uniref:hypothetical protein n=1 Tax=Curvivirga aplysinae TaxID=2529852 RepID=UPI001C3F7EAC|nr:hypothetical protein [Curvivirga aplysinae]MTI09363.1 hypothetical protein [Curvivirga aplysinae]